LSWKTVRSSGMPHTVRLADGASRVILRGEAAHTGQLLPCRKYVPVYVCGCFSVIYPLDRHVTRA